jgi:hypothetical protein
LAALDGIVAQVAQALDQTYLAGLWSGTLFFDLLWTARFPQALPDARPPQLTRPLPLRAPTWSWASIEGQICPSFGGFSPEPSKVLCTTLSANISTTQDDFTQITKGSLKTLGRIVEGVWSETSLKDLRKNLKLCIGTDVFKGSVDIDTVEDWSNRKAQSESALKCLPLLLFASRRGVAFQGLVIDPVDEQDIEYIRIGVFFVSKHDDSRPDIEGYLKLYQRIEERHICLV